MIQKYYLKDSKDWRDLRKDLNLTFNLIQEKPNHYPCLSVVETSHPAKFVCFVYLADFAKFFVDLKQILIKE